MTDQLYSIAVCEDEDAVRKEICRMCGEILDEAGIRHEITPFSAAEELERAMNAEKRAFQLLILDVKLEGMSGIEFARKLRRQRERVGILFLTGYECFWKEALRARPIQYLLKPLKREELKEVLLEEWDFNHRPQTVVFQGGGRVLKLRLEAILYVESCGNHRIQICMTDRTEDFFMTLVEAERVLSSGSFRRCHNSYLVNMEHVEKLTPTALCMDNGAKLPVGRSSYKKFVEAYIPWANRYHS